MLRRGRRISGRRIGSDPFLQLQPSPNTSPDVCFPQVRAKSEAGAHGCRPCWREPVSLPGRGWGEGEAGGGGREGKRGVRRKEGERDNPEMSPYSDGNLSSLVGLGADSNTGSFTRWNKDNNDH